MALSSRDLSHRTFSGVFYLLLLSCSDDPTLPTGANSCNAVDLPLTGEPNAPVITDVALEVQPGVGVVLLVTAADPQGSRDLRDVPQIVRVFQDTGCDGSPIVIEAELASSGVQESFGVVVPSSNQALFNTMTAAESWPVALDFTDASGNATSGRVMARIIRP